MRYNNERLLQWACRTLVWCERFISMWIGLSKKRAYIVWFGVMVSVCCAPYVYAKKQPLITNASVSIRTMSTGELLQAGGVANANWNMVEVVLPGYLGKRFPFGAVQFRHSVERDKCLMGNGFWLSLGECNSISSGDHRTLFSLLPTSSGALQIQAIATDGCLAVESSGKTQVVKIQSCYKEPNTPIDLRWLWILTPPVIDTKLAM